MIVANFIFKLKKVDDEYHKLNTLIQQAEKDNAGFIDKTVWLSQDNLTYNVMYYFMNMETLNIFASHPIHIEAKRKYKNWYSGYQVIISEVIKTYGDNNIEQILDNRRKGYGE